MSSLSTTYSSNRQNVVVASHGSTGVMPTSFQNIAYTDYIDAVVVSFTNAVPGNFGVYGMTFHTFCANKTGTIGSMTVGTINATAQSSGYYLNYFVGQDNVPPFQIPLGLGTIVVCFAPLIRPSCSSGPV